MPKYTQQNQASNCGAFSIAYLLWELEKAAYQYDHPEDALAFIDAIYNAVKFGDSIYKFDNPVKSIMSSEHCSPVKMVNYLENQGIKTTCLIPVDPPFIAFIRAVNTSTLKPLFNFTYEDPLKALRPNQYTISMAVNTFDITDSDMLLHYVLIKKHAKNATCTVYDPSDGEENTDQSLSVGSPIAGSPWLYTGILIAVAS
ncbi:hypothetical protein [Eubacterium limosum]|uniref:hypothetical protein n=1 Tax=Eubacterium limosum TaxID=1736 RepID=UPI0022E419C6|nr:hypothetical protein [Eubacterium limosum]